MQVAVFGLGYVGCTSAGCLASRGHRVIGIDIEPSKVAALNAGRATVRETGLDDLVAGARRAGLLDARTTIGDALDGADIAIVCVGTPSAADGSHDMRFVAEVSRTIAAALDPQRPAPLAVVYRSTMRSGSVERLIRPIFEAELGSACDRVVQLAYNPEFMREASAVADFFDPPKIVIGTLDGARCEPLERLNEGLAAPVFRVGMREAELTKLVDNSWHAVKVAFANEIGRICEQQEISARRMHAMFAADTKLNISPAYTRPGGAFGGSCLPKDVRALQRMATELGANAHLIESLLRSDDAHKHHQFRRATAGLSSGARVLVVGLAFKHGTDDLRESPAVDLVRMLLDAGFAVSVYDPAIEPAALVGQNLGYAYAHLPTVGDLLVGQAVAESGAFDLVVLTGELGRDFDSSGTPTIDLGTIA